MDVLTLVCLLMLLFATLWVSTLFFFKAACVDVTSVVPCGLDASEALEGGGWMGGASVLCKHPLRSARLGLAFSTGERKWMSGKEGKKNPTQKYFLDPWDPQRAASLKIGENLAWTFC